MANAMKLALSFTVLLIVGSTGALKATALSTNYYDQSCPRALGRITGVVVREVLKDRGLAAKLLRLHFHDCFVRGCDASVLIAKPDKTAEMDGPPNAFSLGGFDVIDQAKAAVEAICPGIVSCADIVALAAREGVRALDPRRFGSNPIWDVPLGRKDGNISNANETILFLPSPGSTAAQLIVSFAVKNLTIQQMVALSGAHTIGTANCTIDDTRLYNFTGRGDTDPTINATYATYLKSECPHNIKTKRIAMKDFLDPPSSSNNGTFDNEYYVNVEENKGLFTSDAALITTILTKTFVDAYAANDTKFQLDFNEAMVAMGQIEVLTTGYVRRNCSVAFS